MIVNHRLTRSLYINILELQKEGWSKWDHA